MIHRGNVKEVIDELAYVKEVIDIVPISYLDEIAHQLKVSFNGKY